MQRPHKRLALVAVAATAGVAPALAISTAARATGAATTTSRTGTTATTATPATPTPKQIRAALKQAESSDQLWATINQCNAAGDEIGIRGQMPSLSFDSTLLMVVQLDQWSPTLNRYVPLSHTYKLGGKTFGPGASVQEGLTLRFSGSVTLIGHITFEWFLNHKLLGSTTRATTGSHTDDAGTPKGYSVGTCSTT